MRKHQQIILSILLTLILMGLAYWAGQDQPVQVTKPVVRLVRDVPAGRQLVAEDLALVELPETAIQDYYIPELAGAIGWWSSVPLSEGEILLSSKLSQLAQGIHYPKPGNGRRLMTIELSSGAANGFYLGPGNRIDLILVPRDDRDGLEPTQTIRNIEIVEVFGADQASSGFFASASPSSALLCLDVTALQAEQISEAKSRADIQVAVINEPLDPGR